MKVLFITSSRIGDAVLSAGLLDYMAREYPAAKVTIVCGRLAAPLFEGYPRLERIIVLDKKKHNRHWFDLWREVAPQSWDIVVDLRNSAVSRLVRAKQRYVFSKRIDQNLHKVEQNAAVMNLSPAPGPRLWFSQQQQKKAQGLVPGGSPVLGVGPAANWQGKTWPAERFAQIIEFITAPGGILPEARVAVFAAPGEEDTAYKALNSVPENRRVDVIAKADPGVAAAAIARCDFYIGNDSGLTHCAAAAGVPTLALFGPSWPHLYRPWGAQADYISTPESYDELVSYEGYRPETAPGLMETLSVSAVQQKITEFWRKRRAA